jgi:surface adhesion protein
VTLSNGQTITIPVGSSSASVNFTAPNDALAGGNSLSVKIDDAKGGNYEKLEVDGKSADTSITDTQDTTNLSLTATGTVDEGGQITYTATLTNAAGTPVTVTLSNGAVITIEAGKTTGSVTVDAPKDDVYKDAGQVEVTIKDATGGNFENLVTSDTPAVTSVNDTIDTSTVSLSATSSVAEGGTVVYTATVGAPVTGSPVVVTLSNGQTITIPVGSSSASVNFTAPNDALAGGSSLSVKIDDAKGGNYEKLEVDGKSADTSVTDTADTTTLSLSATDSVAEGGSIVHRSGQNHRFRNRRRAEGRRLQRRQHRRGGDQRRDWREFREPDHQRHPGGHYRQRHYRYQHCFADSHFERRRRRNCGLYRDGQRTSHRLAGDRDPVQWSDHHHPGR